MVDDEMGHELFDGDVPTKLIGDEGRVSNFDIFTHKLRRDSWSSISPCLRDGR